MGKGFTDIDIDDREVQQAIRNAIAGARPRQRQAAERSGKFLVADMRRRLTRAGRVASGRLHRAVAFRIVEHGDSLTIEAGPRVGDPSVEPYDVVVDEGRAPGRPPPPPGALTDWLARRGLPERAEYPVAKKIGEEGIEATPYLDITADRSAAVLKEVDALLTDIAEML